MQQVEVPCAKCAHPRTNVVSARFEFVPDEQGIKVHHQTVYVLRCPNAACLYGFQATIKVGKPIAPSSEQEP